MPKKPLLPGKNVGRDGGVYQEVGPDGKRPNFATVADYDRLPPTIEPGHAWQPIDCTPHGCGE